MFTGSKHEVADIFRKYGKEYLERYKQPAYILKVIGSIEKCRTAALGGHIDQCDSCGYKRISYNSCRNRHCPKCQSLAREKWIDERKKELLPVKYFHVVFTIPEELNRITLQNKKIVYDILFKAASETLLKLSKDKKHLGAETGILSVLHTWGQNLMEHPHLHCIVTGGGLSEDGKQWIEKKKGKNQKKDFFIHVNVISDLFKKIFLSYFKKASKNKLLLFNGSISGLNNAAVFQKLLNDLYSKKWITYCKQPFGGAEQVINYLGRYTHRVAISNHRIKCIEGGKVTFSYKDYRNSNETKEMTLEALEFIRRFLLHILPNNFYKIRYYGILSSRNKKEKLSMCKQILGVNENEKETVESDNLEYGKHIDASKCPKCKKGRMVLEERMMVIPLNANRSP
ncbi:MAG: IS91 family transposase [Ignavibacteriales bacterium CG_4_9_14_3_um_filter_30_11]|nr:MAG: IS91 family transposase [Ignavibacteriales bacterium CG_4_9_14_3_um_filter_30_11]